MTTTSPTDTPVSHTRRWWRRLSLGVLWLVLAVWALVLVTLGALHFWIVPRITDWRGDLERWASQAMGQTVQIGELRALPSTLPDWLPTPPALAASDVRLLDEQGQVALRLPHVQLSVSLSSLWRWGFEQLVIDGPELQVRRLADGRIQVAGQDVAANAAGDTRVAEWLLAQRELVIRRGTVRWTDELRGAPPLALSDVQIQLRHRGRRHDWQIDAVPPAEWGQPFAISATLSDPLLPWQPAEQPVWQRWQGPIVAEFPAVDIQRLRHHLDGQRWGMDWQTGVGSLVLQTELERGLPVALQARLGLRDVFVRLGQGLEPLRLRSLQGPVRLERSATHWRAQSDGLTLQIDTETPWSGGRWDWRIQGSDPTAPEQVTLQADGVDLARLATLAERLPLGPTVLKALQRTQPAGVLQGLQAQWRPPTEPDAPWWRGQYRVDGEWQGLSLASEPSGRTSSHGPYPLPGRPGIEGAHLRFSAHQDGGEATLALRDGALDLPGVFEDSRIPLQRLDAALRWRVDGPRWDVWLDQVSAANADAQGSATVHWHTDPRPGAERFPGVLDLSATLTQGNATRVHRYLPLSVGPEVRRYVRDAVQAGTVPRVDFRVRGTVHDAPYVNGVDGDFRIRADLRDVRLDYVPPFLSNPSAPRWPALSQLSGELLLDRLNFGVTGISAAVQGLPGLLAQQGQVHIRHLGGHAPTLLEVRTRIAGPGQTLLGFVRASPVDAWLGGALAQAKASGNAQLDLALDLPFNNVRATEVKGQLRLDGNDLHLHPQAPVLQATKGDLQFSERGFHIASASAQLLGGELRFQGGWAAGEPGPRFQGEGRASADGLRAAGPAALARVLAGASGATSYRARLGFVQGDPVMDVQTDLQGLALPLPAPLGKRADEAVPLRWQRQRAPDRPHDSLLLDFGQGERALRVRYDRALDAPEPRVLRGSVALGRDADQLGLPASGVQAQIRLAQLPLADWRQWLTQSAGIDMRAVADSQAQGPSYLPDRLALHTGVLDADGRRFENVVLGATRQGLDWRANVDAPEVSGYVDMRLAPDGAVKHWHARLARLHLPASTARDAERLTSGVTDLPGVDLVVNDFRLAGRSLGRLAVNAEPAGRAQDREWRLNTLELTTPEARLRASGQWSLPVALDASAGAQRRTQLGVQLDIDDSGELLARFGHPGTVRGAKGRIEGQVAWLGTPFQPDWRSATGQVQVQVERGQFLKADPGAAKLLGVLSLQALPRRLALDFRDVFSEGFAFDFVRGDARIERGVVSTNNLQMKGVNAAVLMEGSADIVRETQDLKAVVVPELNAGTASLIATAINPAVGLGTFLAQFLLNQPLQSAATQTFHISGTWADPKIDKVPRPATPAPETSR